MTTTHHPSIRETLAALRAKHARALSLPVLLQDGHRAPAQPTPPVPEPALRQNSRSVKHLPQAVRWDVICRVLAERGPMTAERLAPLVGMCKQYTSRNLHRMRSSGRVAIAAKAIGPTNGRPTYHYDLPERVIGPVPDAMPKWAAAVLNLAGARGKITNRDLLGQGLTSDRNTANKRLLKLEKLGLLALVATAPRQGRPEKIYSPASAVPACPGE